MYQAHRVIVLREQARLPQNHRFRGSTGVALHLTRERSGTDNEYSETNTDKTQVGLQAAELLIGF